MKCLKTTENSLFLVNTHALTHWETDIAAFSLQSSWLCKLCISSGFFQVCVLCPALSSCPMPCFFLTPACLGVCHAEKTNNSKSHSKHEFISLERYEWCAFWIFFLTIYGTAEMALLQLHTMKLFFFFSKSDVLIIPQKLRQVGNVQHSF